jgi:hypothetical protein
MLYAFPPSMSIFIIELEHCLFDERDTSVAMHICLLSVTFRETRKLWAVQTVCLLKA